MNYQQRIHEWMVRTFSSDLYTLKKERAFRFLEEAVELFQAEGGTKEELVQIAQYVYGRPIGKTAQEVGGVMVTLAGLCAVKGIDMEAEGWREYFRIDTLEMIEKIRAKQVSKRLAMVEGEPEKNNKDNGEQVCTTYHSIAVGLKCQNCGRLKEEHERKSEPSELVNRLRVRHAESDPFNYSTSIWKKAADRIEELEAQLSTKEK